MIELIAEIGINHNGDIGIAKRLIDIANSAGFSYVKFQKRCIERLFTDEELDKPKESPWGKTYREYKEHLEFSEAEYDEIDAYCKTVGIKWFASPWDMESLQFLRKYNNPFIKIPSALITNHRFLTACRNIVSGDKQSIILSTGMADTTIVDTAIECIGKDVIDCLMHCTSTYPTKPQDINLDIIPKWKSCHYPMKIGFSNHYPGLLAMIGAAVCGTEMIEMHVTLDRAMYGSDQAASIEPEGMFKIAKYCKTIPEMMGDGVKKIYKSEFPSIEKLRR